MKTNYKNKVSILGYDKTFFQRKRSNGFTLGFYFILFFVFSNVFDPYNSYNLKLTSILLLFLLGFIEFFLVRKFIFKKEVCALYCIVLFFPLLGLFFTLMNGANISNIIDKSYLSFSLILVLAIFLSSQRYFYYLYISIIVVLRVYSFIVLLVLLNIVFSLEIQLIEEYVRVSMSSGYLYLNERVYSGVSLYYIYFISGPLLVFLLVHDSYKFIYHRNLLYFMFMITSFIALILIGTRMSMLISVFSVFIIFFLYSKMYIKWLMFLIFFFTLVVVVFSGFISGVFSLDDSSNFLKFTYLDGYFKLYEQYLILGQGFNAVSYSHDFRAMFDPAALNNGAFKLELTYFELLRVYGFVFGSMFILVVFFMIYYAISRLRGKSNEWFALFFPIYLVSASLNPYLFASIGALVFIFYFSLFLNKSNFELR